MLPQHPLDECPSAITVFEGYQFVYLGHRQVNRGHCLGERWRVRKMIDQCVGSERQ